MPEEVQLHHDLGANLGHGVPFQGTYMRTYLHTYFFFFTRRKRVSRATEGGVIRHLLDACRFSAPLMVSYALR